MCSMMRVEKGSRSERRETDLEGQVRRVEMRIRRPRKSSLRRRIRLGCRMSAESKLPLLWLREIDEEIADEMFRNTKQ